MTSAATEQIVHPVRLVEAKTIAELLHCAQATVYNLANEGKLPVVRLGTHYRFDYDAVIEWIKNGGTAAESIRNHSE